VVREERPGIDGPGPGHHQGGHAGDKVRAVEVGAETFRALDASHHDMVEGFGGVEARLAGHGEGSQAQHTLRMRCMATSRMKRTRCSF
jgi:hypothetical protein